MDIDMERKTQSRFDEFLRAPNSSGVGGASITEKLLMGMVYYKESIARENQIFDQKYKDGELKWKNKVALTVASENFIKEISGIAYISKF